MSTWRRFLRPILWYGALACCGCHHHTSPVPSADPADVPSRVCSYAELSLQAAVEANDDIAERIAQCAFSTQPSGRHHSDLLWLYSMWQVHDWLRPVVEVATDAGPGSIEIVLELCQANRESLATGLTCSSAVITELSVLAKKAREKGEYAQCARAYSYIENMFPPTENMPYYLYRHTECLHLAGADDLAADAFLRLWRSYPGNPRVAEAADVLGLGVEWQQPPQGAD